MSVGGQEAGKEFMATIRQNMRPSRTMIFSYTYRTQAGEDDLNSRWCSSPATV